MKEAGNQEDCIMGHANEKSLDLLCENLRKQIGYHKNLLEAVRGERDTLVSADIQKIQDLTYHKEGLISSIKALEQSRIQLAGEIAADYQVQFDDLTLDNLIVAIQGRSLEYADKLRGIQNTLSLLVQRIREQNDRSRRLVEESLEHITQMKQNALDEIKAKSVTYGASGQRQKQESRARLISQEA